MRSSSKEHCPKNDQLKNVSLINRNVMNVSEMLKTSRQRMMRIILTHISILCKFKNCRFHYIICAQPNTIAPLVLLNFFSIYTFFLSKMSIFFLLLFDVIVRKSGKWPLRWIIRDNTVFVCLDFDVILTEVPTQCWHLANHFRDI